MKLKHTNRSWLADLSDRTFVNFSDYLLGRHVYGVNVRSIEGKTHHPPWSLVLSYELEIRKKTYEKVVDGATLATALQEVCQDASHRERHFLAPFALGASSVASNSTQKDFMKAPSEKEYRLWSPYNSKGTRRGKRAGSKADTRKKDKGKGKGKGKGKTEVPKGRGKHRHSHDDNGKEICFRWNEGLCNDTACPRTHGVCSWCKGPHQVKDCKSAPQ